MFKNIQNLNWNEPIKSFKIDKLNDVVEHAKYLMDKYTVKKTKYVEVSHWWNINHNDNHQNNIDKEEKKVFENFFDADDRTTTFGFVPREGFVHCYDTDPNYQYYYRPLVRMNCKKLVNPLRHKLGTTGMRSVNYGRKGEHHLYAYLLGQKKKPKTRNNYKNDYDDSMLKKQYDIGRWVFVQHPCFIDKQYGISHLCHNNWCYNWRHHIFENNEINKGRNGCPGGIHCFHKVRCERPGHYALS